MAVRVLYFASLRDALGQTEEKTVLPDFAPTWLLVAANGPGWLRPVTCVAR